MVEQAAAQQQVPEDVIDPSKTRDKVMEILGGIDRRRFETIQDVQDFLQDELLPVVVQIAKDADVLSYYVRQHDEALDGLESSGDSQLLPEHAAEIKEQILACNAIFEQITQVAPVPGIPERIEKGKRLVEFIDSITMEAEEEDAAAQE